jgi:drug/metabolite transporter (DMT)-like permease
MRVMISTKLFTFPAKLSLLGACWVVVSSISIASPFVMNRSKVLEPISAFGCCKSVAVSRLYHVIGYICYTSVVMWFYLSIASVFALAVAELTQQHLLNKDNGFTARASAVLTFIFQSLLTLPILAITGQLGQLFSVFHPTLLTRMLFVAFIGSIGMVFYLRSFKVKNISISTIFVSASTIVSTTLGIIFFDESTSLIKFLGILLVLGAIVSLNYKNAVLEKNHLFGLLAGLLFGVAYTIDKSVLMTVPPLVYIFWTFMSVSLFGFLFNPRDVISSVGGRSLIAFRPIVISGLGYFVYNFCTYSAYRFGGEVGRVDAINNSQVFLIILFEYFILKHTHSMFKKLVSAAIAFIGVLLLR